MVFADKTLNKYEYQNLFKGSFTYMTVAHACNMTNLRVAADKMVQQVIAYGYKHSLHNEESLNFSQNIAVFTRAGIAAYKADGRVACSEAEKYIRQLANYANTLK